MSREESYNERFNNNDNYNSKNSNFTKSSESKTPLIKINIILDNNESRDLTLYKGENIEDSIKRFFKENNFNKETRNFLKNEIVKKLTSEYEKCIFYFNLLQYKIQKMEMKNMKMKKMKMKKMKMKNMKMKNMKMKNMKMKKMKIMQRKMK